MRVRNLTPHPLRIVREDDHWAEWPSEGSVRAVESDSGHKTVKAHGAQWPFKRSGEMPMGVDCVVREYKGVENLPDDLEPGDLVVVSVLAFQAIHDVTEERYGMGFASLEGGGELIPRGALLAYPDTGPQSVIRDENGAIAGVRRLVVSHRQNRRSGDGGQSLLSGTGGPTSMVEGGSP